MSLWEGLWSNRQLQPDIAPQLRAMKRQAPTRAVVASLLDWRKGKKVAASNWARESRVFTGNFEQVNRTITSHVILPSVYNVYINLRSYSIPKHISRLIYFICQFNHLHFQKLILVVVTTGHFRGSSTFA